MTVNRDQLIKAWESASRVSSGDSIVSMTYFTGTHIVCTDLDRFISVEFKTDFQCAISPKKPLAFLKSLSSETVSLSIIDASLEIKFGRAKSKFQTHVVGEEAQPPWPDVGAETDMRPFPFDLERFSTCVALCSGFVSNDTSRMILNGIHVSPVDGATYIEATDGRRLARVKVADDVLDKPVILFAPFLSLLRNEEITYYTITNNFITFQCASGTKYAGRVIDGTYPNTKQVIPNTDEHVKVCFPEDIESYIRRAMIASVTSIKLSITETDCTLTASSPDIGEVVETFEVASSGSCEVVLNPAYLLQLVKANTSVAFAADKPAIVEYMGGVVLAMPFRIM